MPSFASALETTLHNALSHATERHHEYATLEHLLLALIDDEHAAKVMQACGVDLGELTDTVTHYLDTELDSLKIAGTVDPSQTSGFQRVVQRAILHVQSSGKEEVTGANVLVALLRARELCRLFPAAAGHEPPRRGLLSLARRRQGRGDPRAAQVGRAGGREEERDQEEGRRARPVHGQSQREGQGRKGRSADRPHGRGRSHDSDPVPPLEEQPALCG